MAQSENAPLFLPLRAEGRVRVRARKRFSRPFSRTATSRSRVIISARAPRLKTSSAPNSRRLRHFPAKTLAIEYSIARGLRHAASKTRKLVFRGRPALRVRPAPGFHAAPTAGTLRRTGKTWPAVYQSLAKAAKLTRDMLYFISSERMKT
jgi:hypothetical protein